MARLKDKYRDEVIPALRDRLNKTNDLAVPRLEKVVISMGVGDAIVDNKRLDEAVGHLTTLSGQKPQITRARRSVAGFKLREGMPVGCRVTLRRQRMWEFLDRLIALALPRVRDFRGLSPDSFDGRGNYSLGLTEQMVFPEIDPDSVGHTQGMNITVVTTARTDEEGRELLRELGMPFQKEDQD
ncbi:MAG TPA: 50S ribosomal protein L5 [Planctomycetaceae bacterium]|nr:50S ribosomal protein L5 [Planctomycetaceae bacterium]|tara:strand:- start:1781 stop:2332 length:552 start_codon:yes stop_codon:yes gene_type:complete